MTFCKPNPVDLNPKDAQRAAARCAGSAPPAMTAWITSLLWAMCMWLVPLEGWAGCTLTDNSSPVDVVNGARVVVLTFPTPSNIPTLNTNAAVGSVLYTMTGTPNDTTGTFSCTSSFKLSRRGTTGSTMTAGSYTNVYPTTISGIGMQITYPDASGSAAQFPYTENSNRPAGTPVTNIKGQRTTIRLIKTGSITAGGTLTGEFAGFFATETVGGAETQVTSLRFSGIVITPSVPTCEVMTESKSIAVNMGQVSVGQFQGQGSTAGDRQRFDINLSCSGGDAGNSTKVYITLTDNNNSANTSEVLSLTPEPSKAEGVGLNIFNEESGNKIKFGPDSSAPNNPNQWFVKQVDSGASSITIPLSAQYVQTGSSVTGGTANAVATFTMSYQ